jgi:4-hydroxy-2-oxoheptanedioate aldolase
MTENPLKIKLSLGEPILGIWSIIPSPIMAEIFGLAGFDFQILDMEHGIFDLQALDANIRACESSGCSPLVRVPGVAPFSVQSVLDMGAHGVVFPQVLDAEAARTAVRSMKYAPDGVRGYNPFTRAALYANPATCESGKLNNSFGLASVIIENENALNSLDQILQIPGLDIIYLGVYDMAVSMGCKGNVRDSRVVDFVETTIGRIRKADKAAGVMVMNRQDMDRMLRLGANVIVHTVDSYLVHKAACGSVTAFRELRKAILK